MTARDKMDMVFLRGLTGMIFLREPRELTDMISSATSDMTKRYRTIQDIVVLEILEHLQKIAEF